MQRCPAPFEPFDCCPRRIPTARTIQEEIQQDPSVKIDICTISAVSTQQHWTPPFKLHTSLSHRFTAVLGQPSTTLTSSFERYALDFASVITPASQ
ncbi:uncharacterized protein G6M90_00g018200 [Metarhizium brunneum]|uniref:Uncharacterized protein n=1 Tax=Metarhizium brunneum TaxID=500148 RepID=A0A7D5USA9_9HYPO|nr:hypothetical protein G6M90_00g018200 [Metarhizium brunneum]